MSPDEARARHAELTSRLADRKLSKRQADELADEAFELEETFPEIRSEAMARERRWGDRIDARGRKTSSSREPKGRGRSFEERQVAGRRRAAQRRQGKGQAKPRSAGRGRARSRARRSRKGFGPRSRRAFRETGIPQATTSATQLGLQALGLLIGLSFAYLILSNAQRGGRRSAIQQIADAAGDATERFLRPVDPLRGAAARGGTRFVSPDKVFGRLEELGGDQAVDPSALRPHLQDLLDTLEGQRRHAGARLGQVGGTIDLGGR